MNNMRKLIVLLVPLLLFSFTQVFAGSSDTWKSCCSSGCDYQPSCSPITFSFGTYYCCNSGWSTSLCSECGGGGGGGGGGGTTSTTTTSTTTTTSSTTTTSTTIPPSIPNCNSISPTVTVLTPLVPSASTLKASVTFSCQEWNYTVRNLTLILYIDNQEWAQCFLNRKGLVTDFGWNGTQMDDSSSNCKRGCQSCGNNGKWDCDNKMNCKHKDYDLWVYSNSSKNFVNVTFTCTLPQLSPGSHTLTVLPVIYHSSIEMKPSKATFMVVSTDGKAILQTLTQPFKVLLRIVFPFLI